jgi:cell division transport system permease protein
LPRIEFQLAELITNLRRNGLLTLAAVITVMCAMVVFGLFNLANLNLQQVLHEEANKAQISAFLDKSLTEPDRAKVEQAIKALPNVAECTYVSSEEGFARLKKDLDSNVLNALDQEGQHRLPAKYTVTPRDPKVIAQVADGLRAIKGVTEVAYGKEVVGVLNSLLVQAKHVGAIALFLLALATYAIISNAIRLTIYARRREIRIMQLVGATDGFIRVPFLLEGLFHGLVGGALAVVVTFTLYGHLASSMGQLLPFLKVVQPHALVVSYTFTLIGTGAAIGVISSVMAMRQFLAQA